MGRRCEERQIISCKRVVIENAFGLLKGRWKRLHYIDVNTVEKICSRITAACVLHNFCILQDDYLEDIVGEPEEPTILNVSGERVPNDRQYRLAQEKRNEIKEYLNH
uniref:DDE Tnp4 domain-containing protein n=1 Tax=Cacopsylla melanoneura TaxID=428564 RepID=A0A8D8WK66_9HEMI